MGDMGLVLAMLVSVMLELEMVILPMDTMAKGLLTLSQRLRLMLDFSMEVMDTPLLATMVKDLLMPMPDIFMVATDMDLVLAMVLDTVATITVRISAKSFTIVA